MKKAFYILILFSFYKTISAQTVEHTKTLIILEYELNPQKPRKKASLKDTFLIIKSDPKNQINLADYELKKYNVNIIAIPDTSVKPEIKGLIKSYQFEMQKGAKFYSEADISEKNLSDSTYCTWAFLYNFNDNATYMNYYYTFDENDRLTHYHADCYAQKDFIKYKYSDAGDLTQIDDGGRHITIEYEGKLIKKIYYHQWNNEKEQYFPISYIEVIHD